MTTTGLDVFDATVQQTNTWLRTIMDGLGAEDREQAYQALRGTLHALRDFLTVDEGAHLSAQLPMLVRGIYYEGWDPSRAPTQERSREAFLRRVAAAFERAPAVDPERAARAALRALVANVSPGQADQVRRLLPEDVRQLWP